MNRGTLIIGSLALALAGAGCTADRVAALDTGVLLGGDGAGDLGKNSMLSYAIADTAQGSCYGEKAGTTCPAAGLAYFGQDAQYTGRAPDYTPSKDGLTVLDNVTGLTWQRSPDTNGDGVIKSNDKLTWAEAQALPARLNAAKYGGFSDWRLPTIKQLYSLILFSGTDPSGMSGSDTSSLTPFIHKTFKFAYGETSAGERIIDSQYASSTLYVSTASEKLLFGVNFADGRIKGYGLNMPGGETKTFFVQCVRGNPAQGNNTLTDNGDGSITDRATGLTWSRKDSGQGMTWKDALDYARINNGASYLGHKDWRLPNAKELQSIVDYTRSPDSSATAAADPKYFSVTLIKNEAGQSDFPYYWTSTTHASSNGMGGGAVYVAFGRSLGYINGSWRDVHGAGSQRSDPKSGNPKSYPRGHGPRGDAIRIYNFVRLVRGGARLTPGGGPVQDGGSVPADGGPLPRVDGSPPPRVDGGPPPRVDGSPPPAVQEPDGLRQARRLPARRQARLQVRPRPGGESTPASRPAPRTRTAPARRG